MSVAHGAFCRFWYVWETLKNHIYYLFGLLHPAVVPLMQRTACAREIPLFASRQSREHFVRNDGLDWTALIVLYFQYLCTS